jgi:OPA family glycerol-3-phosphate transporter-like MFS transporter/OPA family sugar phosphate sensor protein UhpC-like MFS transporter
MTSIPSAAAQTAAANHDEVRRQYRYWQTRILLATIAGYALFYFVRKNLSIAMPVMEQELGISKKGLGLFLTLHGLLYGVSKFANGIIGDHMNARWFMVAGLCLCAVVNVFFGLGSSVLLFGLLWMLNGWFQGMGFPPCARLMTHWFPPKVLATRMSIWNSSHSIGAGLVVVLCGYLAVRDWRLCFHVPAALAIVGAAGLAFVLRDTPESMGLPPVEGTADSRSKSAEPLARTLQSLVFGNRYIWLLSLANFFVYTVRYGILDWGPTFLKQARHVELSKAGWLVAAFEVSGILGMLSSGWLTDRLFGGRGARACLVYMALCVASLLAFWRIPASSSALGAAVLCSAGFFVYGPQSLVGIAAANLATKRAAASAIGLTGLFGYLSTIVSGVGIGVLVQRQGWDAGFLMFVVAAVLGAALFALCWPAAAHGYRRREEVR